MAETNGAATNRAADQPAPGFSAPAAALPPVADRLEQVEHRARIEGLRLDPAAAKALNDTLARLKARVDDLVGECRDLDAPLKYGANFVGRTVADRLRDTAAGDDSAVTPVLTSFGEVLGDVQAIVQIAAGRYQVADGEAADQLRRAVEPFGLRADI
ncbi:MAG: hypothetical protein ABW215_17095 [Kibdelosporangium sp.]